MFFVNCISAYRALDAWRLGVLMSKRYVGDMSGRKKGQTFSRNYKAQRLWLKEAVVIVALIVSD